MAFKEFVYVHAYDFYYKWTPTGSLEIPTGWPDSTFTDSVGTGLGRVNQCFYNIGASIPNTITTRNTASIGDSGSAALPWGSMAVDMLWNCLVPSMSSVETTSSFNAGRGTWLNNTKYNFTYTSNSFCHDHGHPLGSPAAGNGPEVYPITSSWKAVEPFMTASKMQYAVQGTTAAGSTPFPGTIQQNSFGDKPYAAPSARIESIPAFNEIGVSLTAVNVSFPPGTNPDMITYGVKSTGSFDGRFFDLAGGVGISRADVSASLVQYNENATSNGAAQVKLASEALKKRRLFFPTVEATASLAAGTGWIGGVASNYTAPVNGLNTKEIFDENGGIFNVKFSLKKNTLIDMYPDSGAGSELLIYIHNVASNVTQPSSRTIGSNGFYPPENNIVRVKNTNPVMSFINPATGFLMESFNINVVQYGSRGHLTFEASGSLDNDKYFGCIIDDVSFCKVGVSTDPNLLKPETVGDLLIESVFEEENAGG